MSGPLYRIRQFVQAVRARPLDDRDLAIARAHLPRPAFELFQCMPVGDQRHSLAVLHTLLEQGYRAAPLLQAALLHDIGKAQLGLWHRSAVILLNALSPRALPLVASADPHSWRYPFYLSLHHAELGAQLCAATGLDPDAAELIRRHAQAPPPSAQADPLAPWQRALKSVDDDS